MKDFAHSITKDEEQKQYLLPVVEDHRRPLPIYNKSNLIQYSQTYRK